jgi:anti-sigma28 factor (negative regulator of flagellin synthesis)
MSQISNIGASSAIAKIVANPIQKQTPADSAAPTRASDRLELSGVSHLLQTLKTNDIRTDKVAAIRAQLDNGTYEQDGSKLDAATGKLLDELNQL